MNAKNKLSYIFLIFFVAFLLAAAVSAAVTQMSFFGIREFVRQQFIQEREYKVTVFYTDPVEYAFDVLKIDINTGGTKLRKPNSEASVIGLNYADIPAGNKLTAFDEQATVPRGASIKYQISSDRVYWYYHDGNDWAKVKDCASCGNTAAEMNTFLPYFDMPTDGLQIKTLLRGAEQSPILKSITFTVKGKSSEAFLRADQVNQDRYIFGAAATAYQQDSCGYGFTGDNVIRALLPSAGTAVTSSQTLQAYYNDDNAMLLGVRKNVINDTGGQTETNYTVSSMPANPGAVNNPDVGSSTLNGDEAGADNLDWPVFPALFVTDVTSDPSSKAGDWQNGGTPVLPDDVFGTWRAAVRTLDKTQNPEDVTIASDGNPTANNWDLDGGDTPPGGLPNGGWSAETRWEIDDLNLDSGHTYRLQVLMHGGQDGTPPGEKCEPDVELISNGGFEVPLVQSNSNWDIYPDSYPNMNWRVDWVSTATTYKNHPRPDTARLELHRGVNGWEAGGGSQYAELDTDWDGPGGSLSGEPASVRIYQDLSTIPGYKYKVKFKFSPRPGTNEANNQLELRWDGSIVDTISAAGGSWVSWNEYEYEVTASAYITRIEFRDVGVANSLGTFVDEVSVKCQQPQCDTNAKLKIDFTRIENQNNGNSTANTYVGPAATAYGDGVEIPLTDGSGQFIVDGGFDLSVPGLVLERGVNFVHVLLEGNQRSKDLEIVDNLLTFNDAITTSFENDTQEPLEKQGDGIYADAAGQDEIYPNLGTNQVESYMRVNTRNDGYYLYYECQETAFCGDSILDDGEECDDGNNEDGDGCNAICEIEEGSVTVEGWKVECLEESDLPNWGNGGPSITATTAIDYVENSNEKCELVPDWEFEWNHNKKVVDGGYIGPAPSAQNWNGFDTPTTQNGPAKVVLTETELNSDSEIWLREVLKQGFIPFTSPPKGLKEDNVTAEFYCETDVINYDNLEWIRNMEVGNTYYCVAFNAPIVEPLCGNGELDAGEECDDGNNTNGDGCSSTCKDEGTCIGWDCLDGLEKDFFTTGRYGDNIGHAGAWELAIWEHIDGTDDDYVREEDNFAWLSGADYNFSISYDPTDGKVLYSVGGKTISWFYEAQKAFEFIIPFAKGDADGNSVTLKNMVLNGSPVADITTADNYVGRKIPLSDAEQVNGFTITGTVNLTWSTDPKNEVPGFHIFAMNTHDLPGGETCSDYPCGDGKVNVCHFPDLPAEGTLCVSNSALQSHLDHGDYCGPCQGGDDDDANDDDEGTACEAMVSYWHLDEASGTTFTDSENGYDGSCSGDNCPAPVAGYLDGAQLFSTDDYIGTDDITELNQTTKFTIEGWFKDGNTNAYNRLFHKGDDLSNDVSAASYSGDLYFEVGNGTNSYGKWDAYQENINNDSWFHAVFVFDGSGSTNQERMKLYVNGIERSLTFSGTIPQYTADLSGYDFIMSKDDTHPWNGVIDEVALFSYAFSQSDVTEHYGAQGYCGYEGGDDDDDECDNTCHAPDKTAWVDSDKSSETNCDEDKLHIRVKKDGGDVDLRRTYLHFDDTPTPTTGETVRIRITADAKSSETVGVYAVTWNGSCINWNSAPSVGSLIDTTTISSDGYAYFDVTSVSGGSLDIVLKMVDETLPSGVDEKHIDFTDPCIGLQCDDSDDDDANDDDANDDDDEPPMCSEDPCSNGKNYVCHYPGTQQEMTLCVSYNAIPAHMDHGDTCGQCPAGDDDDANDDDDDPGSCYDYCTDLGYDGGQCKTSASSCVQSGGTYESGGDQFCSANSLSCATYSCPSLPNKCCCSNPPGDDDDDGNDDDSDDDDDPSNVCYFAKSKNTEFYIPFKQSSSGDYPTKGKNKDNVNLTSSNPTSDGYLNLDIDFENLPTDFSNAKLYVQFTDLDLQGDEIKSGSKRGTLFETFKLMDDNNNVLDTLDDNDSQDDNFTWTKSLSNGLFGSSDLTLKTKFTAEVKLTKGSPLKVSNSKEAIKNVKICGDTNQGDDDDDEEENGSGCNKCDGKVTTLTMQYNGSHAAFVKVVQKKNSKVLFNQVVSPGAQFSFTGQDKGTLSTEITLYVNTVQNAKIHTSCSDPIGPGLIAGKFLVVSGDSKNGGTLCPLSPISQLNLPGQLMMAIGSDDHDGDVGMACTLITIPDENQSPPVANPDYVTTTINTAVLIDVPANDTDPDNDLDPGSVTTTTSPTNGFINSIDDITGEVGYAPNQGYVGNDTFNYQICDYLSKCATTTVYIVILDDGEPIPPTALNDTATTTLNTSVGIFVMSNDSDVDGYLVTSTINITSLPTHGTTTYINPVTGEIMYQPDTGYHGADSFVYEICDDDGLCDTATVDITIYPDDDPPGDGPEAFDDFATTPANTPVVIDVVINDTDPDNELDPTTVTILTNPTWGNVTNIHTTSGHATYEPDAGFVGSDTFKYQICNLSGQCDTALVTITISGGGGGGDYPPVAVNDTYTTPLNTPVTFSVLDNDFDPDGYLVPSTLNVTSPVSNGALTSSGTDMTYTPNTDYFGSDLFTYQICDNDGLCDNAVVTINITTGGGGDDDDSDDDDDTPPGRLLPPIANDDNTTTDIDVPVEIVLLINDYDQDGYILPNSTRIIIDPTNGTITSIDDTTGNVVYTPDSGFDGTDRFTYQICDNDGYCDVAEVAVVIAPPPALIVPPVVLDATEPPGPPGPGIGINPQHCNITLAAAPTITVTGFTLPGPDIDSLIQYTLTGGTSWNTISAVTGYGDPDAGGFSFPLNSLTTGDYEVTVRNTLPDGTILFSAVCPFSVNENLVLGANQFALASTPAPMSLTGSVQFIADESQTIYLEATARSINLVNTQNGDIYPLSYDRGLHLWTGELLFEESGWYTLRADLSDGVNTYSRILNPINVIERETVTDENGEPLTEATVTIYQQTGNDFVIWNGEQFGVSNPLLTDDLGFFSVILPQGTYYMSVSKDGYETVNSRIVSVPDYNIVSASLILYPAKSGLNRITSWVTREDTSADFSLIINPLWQASVYEKEERLPNFTYTLEDGSTKALSDSEITGMPTVVFLYGPWNTEVQEQALALENIEALLSGQANFVGLTSYVPSISSERFIERGTYTLPLNVPDSTFFDSWKITSLPSIFILDDNRVLQELIIGSRPQDEIIQIIQSVIDEMNQ
jgi:cysteine-rich repeat protein